jgi:hypothetical protein
MLHTLATGSYAAAAVHAWGQLLLLWVLHGGLKAAGAHLGPILFCPLIARLQLLLVLHKLLLHEQVVLDALHLE